MGASELLREWMGDDEPDVIHSLMGPVLNLGSPLTELSDALLGEVKVALHDRAYVDRLKRHYAAFREVVEQTARAETPDPPSPKVGRTIPARVAAGRSSRDATAGE